MYRHILYLRFSVLFLIVVNGPFSPRECSATDDNGAYSSDQTDFTVSTDPAISSSVQFYPDASDNESTILRDVQTTTPNAVTTAVPLRDIYTATSTVTITVTSTATSTTTSTGTSATTLEVTSNTTKDIVADLYCSRGKLNAYVSVSPAEPCARDTITHATRCVYTCDRGFHRFTGSHFRICLHNTMSGSPLVCKRNFRGYTKRKYIGLIIFFPFIILGFVVIRWWHIGILKIPFLSKFLRRNNNNNNDPEGQTTIARYHKNTESITFDGSLAFTNDVFQIEDEENIVGSNPMYELGLANDYIVEEAIADEEKEKQKQEQAKRKKREEEERMKSLQNNVIPEVKQSSSEREAIR